MLYYVHQLVGLQQYDISIVSSSVTMTLKEIKTQTLLVEELFYHKLNSFFNLSLTESTQLPVIPPLIIANGAR